MKKHIAHNLTFASSILLHTACGVDNESRRKIAAGLGADAQQEQTVEFSFTLPSRASLGKDSQTLENQMTGYAWKIQGQGEKCRDTKIRESFGPYEDARLYINQLVGGCDYAIEIKLGKLATPKLSLLAPANFEQNIRPLLQENCVSCHAEYNDFAEVKKHASNIVAKVEQGTMPPNKPLDGPAIAQFLAWADEGYLENDPNPPQLSPSDSALSEVYFRNNLNDQVKAYELLGRSIFELRRELWIQPDGEALALENRKVLTYRVFSATDESSEASPKP